MEYSTNVLYSGKVKWFNNNQGYGFITLNNTDDIFVHHSGIKIQTQQYKYLTNGEYVEFNLIKPENKYKYQAVNITGINGGKLMCETKNDEKLTKQVRHQKSHYSANINNNDAIEIATMTKTVTGMRNYANIASNK